MSFNAPTCVRRTDGESSPSPSSRPQPLPAARGARPRLDRPDDPLSRGDIQRHTVAVRALAICSAPTSQRPAVGGPRCRLSAEPCPTSGPSMSISSPRPADSGQPDQYQAQAVYQGKTKGLVFGEYACWTSWARAAWAWCSRPSIAA